MRTFISHLLEKVRASAWTIPALLSFTAILLAQFTLWSDETLGDYRYPLLGWFTPSTPEGGQAFLSTVATSMLSVAGISFSSIMVTMTLASQQFGPRLLRNFIKDKYSQAVLGILISTFVFCLVVLRQTQSSGERAFIPQVSIFAAAVLTLICLAMFIRFIHHIITIIQAEEVVADSYKVLVETIKTVFPADEDKQEHRRRDNDLEGWGVSLGKTGYIQAINVPSLVETAKKYDLVLATDVTAGRFISDRQTVIKVVEGPALEDWDEKLVSDLRRSYFVGPVRTPEQDYEYGIHQLVEVALRALSPGINDPFTAMNCIDYLGAGLQKAFSHPLPGSIHRDDDQNIRLFSWVTSYRGLVDAAVNQIRQSSVEMCDVSCRLLEMLTETAAISKLPEQQEALMTQAELIKLNTLPTLKNDYDCQAIHERYDEFTEACHHLLVQ